MIRKKIELNLAAIYTASSNVDLAKKWLDHLKSRSVPGRKHLELALLYTKLGDKFRADSSKLKECFECYQMACELYAKVKSWQEFCLVGLQHGRLLCELSHFKKSIRVANKVLAATFYLTDKVELAKIYNDLSTIYSKDPSNEENIYYAKRLLKKSLKILRDQDLSGEPDLEVYICQNLSAVYNQLEMFDESLKYIEVAYEQIKSPNRHMCVLSDIKYNEGYARFKTSDLEGSVNAFQLSHQYALKSMLLFFFMILSHQ
jgi:tetratricopeptide (TPR) repeat protein